VSPLIVREFSMPQLVFHARDTEYAPSDRVALVTALQESGFVGEKWTAPKSVSGERYLIGDAFLSLVTFMGCAPAIELEPIAEKAESTAFCHIEINPAHEKERFILGSEHAVSRCPHCRQRHASWKELPDTLVHACDKCEVETPLSEYDWKNTAGSGRFFIRLHGIYPQEALPTPALLQRLEKISATAWQYFYIQ